jgi:hypothetical protein
MFFGFLEFGFERCDDLTKTRVSSHLDLYSLPGDARLEYCQQDRDCRLLDFSDSRVGGDGLPVVSLVKTFAEVDLLIQGSSCQWLTWQWSHRLRTSFRSSGSWCRRRVMYKIVEVETFLYLTINSKTVSFSFVEVGLLSSRFCCEHETQHQHRTTA